ncbi:MAG: hypothetical protein KAG61_09425 [Bacteriovoracaceae bacterium]|nr:hypothetical protein [Bacteriovoracaceae bacterium]
MKKQMQEIKAENPSTLVNIMGTECPPLQFLREYTVNSIEAIKRANAKKGVILWGIDPYYLAKDKVEKLCIVDNGDGMTLDEMIHQVATLGVEGANKTHGEDANFGVGGKISAFKNNPEGMVYKSKKNGKCSIVIIALVDSKYVIKEAKSITNKLMPGLLQKEKSGTIVTFLGESLDENTARRISDKGKKDKAGFKYLIQYLNTKFFDIPSQIQITVLDSNDKHGGTKNRTIQGMKRLLNKKSLSKGSLSFNEFNAHWWIQENDFSKNNGTIMGNMGGSCGHIAIILNGEVYEKPYPPYSYLPRFGVYAGMRQVFIYIEPTGDNIYAAIARTRLTVNGNPLSINDMGKLFNDNMPKKLRDFIDAQMGTAQSSTVKDMLKKFLNRFKVPKYIQQTKGDIDGNLVLDHTRKNEKGDLAGCEDGDNPYMPSSDTPIKDLNSRKGSSAKDKEIYGSGRKGKNSMQQGNIADYPDVVWQSVKPMSEDIGIREPGDMEDRVGKFIPNTNTLIINADFAPIDEVIKYWNHRLSITSKGDAKVVRRAVHRSYELNLVDAIIHTKALGRSGANDWNEEIVNKILSDEFSLTTIATPQFHLTSTLKHEIRKDIGRLS